MKIATIRRGRTLAALASMLAVSVCTAARAEAITTATWDGAAPTVTWSTAANWSTGAAPSGSVDTLMLPATSPSCMGWACSYAVDDISGLTIGTLEMDSSADYLVAPMSSADSLELMGGLSFGTYSTSGGGRLLTTMVVPLTLGAGQSWSLTGVPGTPTQLTLGAVTGEPYPLTLNLADGVALQASELDTGRLTIRGSGLVSLAGQTTTPADSIPVSPPPLISTQGVTLADGASLMITTPGAVSGQISVARGSSSTLEVGHGVAPDGTLVVNGNVTLRPNSTLEEWIDQPATAARAARGRHAKPATPQPSADYSQITALGNVMLNGAGLNLSQGYSDQQVVCATMTGGQSYTLLSATHVVGTFSGIANGQVVALGACNPSATGTSYAVVISYNTRAKPQTVTATIVGPGQIETEVGRSLLVNAAMFNVYTVLRNGGYNTSFNAPAAGTLVLTWKARVRGRMVTVAGGSNIARQVGPRRVSIKLTAAGRELLQRSTHLTLTATANFVPSGQRAVSVSRPVKLG